MIRWMKVFRDLWNNRSRTILVILSIAVGVFAIGMIAATYQALTTSLTSQYLDMRPADMILNTAPSLNDDFIASIRHMRGVEEAEGRLVLPLRISLDGEGKTWRDLNLYALADYQDQRLFVVRPEIGNWPPKKGEVLMERASMEYIGVQPGDQVLVKTAGGKKYYLTVAGQAHDLYRIPPVIEGWIYGYVSMDTMRWMGQPDGYNELYVLTNSTDQALIRGISEKVEDRIEDLRLPVYQKTLPNRNEHPLNFIISTVLVLLGLLAGLSLFLSALLVVNIISALVAQQERQIGIIKAVGGKPLQIVQLYFGMVALLGLAACFISIPLSNLGAQALAGFIALLINFDPPKVTYQAQALLLQLAVGLFVPLLAASPSILACTGISPARVLSEYGINQVWSGAGILDTFLNHFPGLSREFILALRNPFRKQKRLILSLVTLTFAGAIFMGIVNLRTSLNDALNQMINFWGYDGWLVTDDYIHNDRLIQTAQRVEGVEQAEAWGFTIGRVVRPDGTESDNLYLLAPPADTKLITLPLVEGRGILPEDENAILVSPGFLANEPGLGVGSQIEVKIEGREATYTIVGVMNMMGNSTIGYFTIIDYEDYQRHVRMAKRANALIFTMTPKDLEGQKAVSSAVETLYDRNNIQVLSNFLITEEREEIDAAFAIIVALLMVMTVVLATVGGLGLMGTMSLNILERTREIGVMRAYGASSNAVFRMVIIEGLVIGLMSWALAIGVSVPISIFLARNIGLSFINYPMQASFSLSGVLIWAVLVVVISILASLFPAMRAVRLTVTQVLAYE
ncbi:MAG: FtsX-like permease family protein [Chloroflexi bacterium]|nr:FtsX-like permease family protein [Chloroflexota bacterium]